MPDRANHSVPERVFRYIREHRIMNAGDRVGIALSGGADSVALLRVLVTLRSELGVVLSAIHINHHLRGAESDADALFAVELGRQFELETHSRDAETTGYSRDHNLGLEAAGRALRYRIFAEIAAEQRLNCIATGHTLDDQSETVMFKFVRGAWTRGLAGIYPVREPATGPEGDAGQTRIVRPLLGIRRKELREYLDLLQQPWREDATNADLKFTRNRVRHELLPLLEGNYNPAIAEVLTGTAEIAREEQQYWDGKVAALWEECAADLSVTAGELRFSFDRERFRNLHVAEQRRLVEYALGQVVALDFRHVESARTAIREGKPASLPDGWDLTVEHSQISLKKRR